MPDQITKTSAAPHRWAQSYSVAKKFDLAEKDWEAADVLPLDVVIDLEEYINHRRPPSQFLRAVLENSFSASLAQMPPGMSLFQLRALSDVLRHYVPDECWRTVSRVESYLRGGA